MPSKKKTEKKLEVRHSPIQGTGVFARKRIRKGQRVVEYTGEIISAAEASRRYNDHDMARHHTFLFEIDDETVLDACAEDNIARFINHSCDPNCETINDDGRIFIEAIKNIQPDSELTYDYNFPVEGKLDMEQIRLYPCKCGSKKCRGTILKTTRKKVEKVLAKEARKKARKAKATKSKTAKKSKKSKKKG